MRAIKKELWICAIRVLEKGERLRKYSKKIMAENFPNLARDINLQTQKAVQTG